MSFLYRTDAKIIRSLEISSNTKHHSQMGWHRFLDICQAKGVTESHFRTYLKSESTVFDDSDLMLFDCMKKGVLNATTQNIYLKSENQIYGEDGEELENDPDGLELVQDDSLNVKYNYSIDTENPECKKLFQNYIYEQLSKKNKTKLSFDDVMSNVKNSLLSHGEVEGLGAYFDNLQNEMYYDFMKTYQVGIYGFYKGKDNFDYELEIANRNNIDSVSQTQKLNDTLNGLENIKDVTFNRADKINIGDVLVNELQTEVRLHRGHSIFYAIFHPINYYRESKSITNAKNALVNLGAEREKVDEFVENTKLEDKLLRDKKNIIRARTIGGVLLGTRFEDLGKEVEISEEEIDDLVMDDETEVTFNNQLQEDIVKSENPVVSNEVPENKEPEQKQESVKENGNPVEQEQIV